MEAYDQGDGDGSCIRSQTFDPTVFDGTAGRDIWTGGSLDDRIAGHGGDDRLRGRAGEDRLTGGDGDDFLDAGADDDLIVGGRGDDFLGGWTGADRMEGGEGDDSYTVDAAGDRVIELAGQGADTVLASVDHALAANVENLTLTGPGDTDGTGNALANTLIGNVGANVLRGGGGADRLEGGGGADTLIGGPDADRLLGGAGRDLGGSGPDTFIFRTPAEAGLGVGRDAVQDFARGSDRIGLAGIDADTGRPGDQGFAFVAGAAFSGDAGELRFAGGVLAGDVDGDRDADFEIALLGVGRLSAGDILL